MDIKPQNHMISKDKIQSKQQDDLIDNIAFILFHYYIYIIYKHAQFSDTKILYSLI